MLFRSKDLNNWTYVKPFAVGMGADCVAWECPNLLRFPNGMAALFVSPLIKNLQTPTAPRSDVVYTVAPYADGAVLLQQRSWWLQDASGPRALELAGVRRHADQLLAKWNGCDNPESADALRGAEVAVARSAFPPPGDNEYYLADLVGARVVNRAGDELGRVQGLRSNGVQQLLEVAVEQGGDALLIPLVEGYIDLKRKNLL